MLTNSNHLVRGLQVWLNLSLNTFGPRALGMIEFKFKHLKELRTSVNQPKSSGPRAPDMIEFKFKYLKEPKDEQHKHFI